MVLPTYTPIEVVAEFDKDLVNIYKFVDHQKSRLRKAALKASKFPVTIHGWHTTPMRNNWLYILSAVSKKDYDDSSLLTLVMTYNDNRGRIWAIMGTYIDGKIIHNFYTPHLFQRYAQRLGLDLTGKELMYRYFKNNASISYSINRKFINETSYIKELTATTKEGVAMGLMTTIGPFLKTFISYDMAKGSQVEDFAISEQKREEHDDEFLKDIALYRGEHTN